MFIDDDKIKAEAYYKKPGMDFYLIKVAIPDIGLYINSIIVDKDKKGELRVKPPKYVSLKFGKPMTIQQVEFDKNKELWQVIIVLAFEAVESYNEPP